MRGPYHLPGAGPKRRPLQVVVVCRGRQRRRCLPTADAHSKRVGGVCVRYEKRLSCARHKIRRRRRRTFDTSDASANTGCERSTNTHTHTYERCDGECSKKKKTSTDASDSARATAECRGHGAYNGRRPTVPVTAAAAAATTTGGSTAAATLPDPPTRVRWNPPTRGRPEVMLEIAACFCVPYQPFCTYPSNLMPSGEPEFQCGPDNVAERLKTFPKNIVSSRPRWRPQWGVPMNGGEGYAVGVKTEKKKKKDDWGMWPPPPPLDDWRLVDAMKTT